MQSCVTTLDCEILLLSLPSASYPSFCPVPMQRLQGPEADYSEMAVGCILSAPKWSTLESIYIGQDKSSVTQEL